MNTLLARPRRARAAALWALAAALLPLQAHEGHDHGEPLAAELLPVLAPRAEAAGDSVELLAVIDAGQLTLYLDRFDTNEPISGARVEVESGGFSAVAASLGDGVYRVAAAPLAQPGEHALVFTVQFGEQADLLETTLKVAAADDAAATARAGPAGWRAALPVAGGVLLGGAALWALAAIGPLRLRRRGGATPPPAAASQNGGQA